ncbi:MAG: UDP-N-acetylmuramoyl-L-alanine--D-glutamate ligase [Candidatus Omnitrophota bacterium]|nr:UDP-N-acetylmuramoyl-L-alanine--D-glutamate ligase [Candidatus Omnitrophota bacterium]
MRNSGYFKNKKVTVVGLGRSGLSCANLLYDLGAEVCLTDSNDNQAIRLNASRIKSKKIRLELGGHSQESIKGRDLVVVSPGVPMNSPALAWAASFNIPVISEIELGWMLCPGTVIAVTGSNGKTTVTTLIGKALEQGSGRKVFVCGNIGTPFCAEVPKIEEGDYVSLEASSFQLEHIRNFKPKVSLILNFTANHLDRYRDLGEYLEAKKRIFINQDESDYLVSNYDDPVLKKLAGESKARKVYFCQEKGLNLNLCAVLAVGGILGINRELIFKVFEDFKGLQHRMEFVAEINSVKFINDSKATTADSALWALRNIEAPVILIAGGRDKGVDYGLILKLAPAKIRQVILLGEAKEKIAVAIGLALPINKVETLTEAVDRAFSLARPGDCILFSPMCSSFDMFSSYEERGKAFKDCVFKLL